VTASPFLIVPVALDGTSERAIQPALELARGREVRLFSWSYDEGEAAASKRYFVELATGLDGHVSVEVAHTDDPNPVGVIARAAKEAGATICMASDRAGRFGQSLAGSTGLAVLEAAGRAIFVGPHVGASGGGEHRSVLVCVDGSRTSEQVLPVAQAWAQDQRAGLRFVRVVSPGTPYPIDPPVDDDRPWTYLCGLALTAGETGGVGGRVAVLFGDAAEEIANHARNVSLVAMATRAHHGLDLALRRSTAMRVVHRAPCPVLLVRAEP
jgi:nucleotide-binding universal stress UspA family protein